MEDEGPGGNMESALQKQMQKIDKLGGGWMGWWMERWRLSRLDCRERRFNESYALDKNG